MPKYETGDLLMVLLGNADNLQKPPVKTAVLILSYDPVDRVYNTLHIGMRYGDIVMRKYTHHEDTIDHPANRYLGKMDISPLKKIFPPSFCETKSMEIRG